MMLDKIEGFIDDKIRCFDFDVNIEQNDAQKNSTQQSDKQGIFQAALCLIFIYIVCVIISWLKLFSR